MSIRKRTWKNADGADTTVWVADVADANGHRERRQFESRKEADAWRIATEGSMRAGTFRGDAAKFWPWAKRAADLTYDDYRPLLRLADALDTSPTRVATRLGGGAPLLRAYLDLLINAHRLDSAKEVAGLLAARHDPVDRERLAAFAERLK